MAKRVRSAAAGATAAQAEVKDTSTQEHAAPASSGSGSNLISQFLSGPQESATPDLTKAQALAVAQAAIALLIVLGFDLPDDVKSAIVTLSVALAASLPVSDAVVRQARAKNARGIADARFELQRAAARSAAQRMTSASRAPMAEEQRMRIRALRSQLAEAARPPSTPATAVVADDGPRGPASTI